MKRSIETVRLYIRWWKTWRSLPIVAWVRAAALYKRGEYRAAAALYEKGLKKFKDHPASHCARMDLAFCLFQEGKLEAAEVQLKLVTHHIPHSREAHLRLARLQLWSGRSLDAAWTMRRAVRIAPGDAEISALFLYSVIDNGGPAFLLKEAVAAALSTELSESYNLLLEATKARVSFMRGNRDKARESLERIAGTENAPLEALIMAADVLIGDREIASARRYLRRALHLSPAHPRVLSLLAESYLCSGPFYNAEYAKQLVTTACQNTNWLSPREMHVLAESYFHLNDRMSALIIASKAKEEGSRLLGTYRDSAMLEKLIENLSSGTQA